MRYLLVNVFEGDALFKEDTSPGLLAIKRLSLIALFDDLLGPVEIIYLFELTEQEDAITKGKLGQDNNDCK